MKPSWLGSITLMLKYINTNNMTEIQNICLTYLQLSIAIQLLDRFFALKMGVIKEISNELGYNSNELLVLMKNHILTN